MKFAKFIWPVLFLACVVGGGFSGYMMQKQQQADTDNLSATEEITVKSDALSIRLFRNAIQETTGNIIVAPRVLSDALSLLQSITGGKTQEELAALQIPEVSRMPDSDINRFALLTTDINVSRISQQHQVLALPFSENYPLALSIFNSLMSDYTPFPSLQFATSDTTSSRTKLLAGSIAYSAPQWEIPFRKADTKEADFDNSSGAIPKYFQMRSRGKYALASAENRSWQAVALPIKTGFRRKSPLVFVAILPQTSARDFATELTPELLTDIRQALDKATPADTLVQLPRFHKFLAPHDYRASLKQLGLNSLFSDTEADFSPFTAEKIHLSAMLFACGISLQESAGSMPADENLENALNLIDFSRPFIWFIGDLNSETPLEFMGLVEEM